MGMLNFDARTVAPQTSMLPVPEAWYKVRISKSNIKPTSKGDGGYLELQCEIIEGQHNGRILYWNLNIFNPSQQAVEIAYKTLSAVSHVTGVFQVNDQQVPDSTVPMLHNIPFYVYAVVGQGQQGPINNIRACKDINGNDPGKQGQGAPMPQGLPGGGFQAPSAPGGAPTGGTAPGGWQGQQGQPAAPTGPGGQTWQPGTNTPPNPAPAPTQWQPNQPAPQPAPQGWTGQPAGQPQQQPAQPAQPAPAGNWQQPGQPQQGQPQPQPWPQQQQTQPAPAPAPAGQWQQGQPAAAPWQRS